MEDVLVKCEKCHSKFTQKYWDDEISWHITINNTNICGKCRYSESSQNKVSRFAKQSKIIGGKIRDRLELWA